MAFTIEDQVKQAELQAEVYRLQKLLYHARARHEVFEPEQSGLRWGELTWLVVCRSH